MSTYIAERPKATTTTTNLPLNVGVGGWAYFPLKASNKKLEACSELYDFVEVNSSFYKLPLPLQAKKWRSMVADSFEFTMRASRELTHEGNLQPTAKNFKIFDRHVELCKELRARILHFQFPPAFVVTPNIVDGWRKFMDNVQRNPERNLDFAFEIRNAKSSSSPEVQSFFEDYDIIPCSDASKTIPKTSSRSRILYSRVFGQGDHTKWSFDTDELSNIAKKVEDTHAKKRYVTFHNITMYDDAARMKNIVSKGKEELPKGAFGLDSFQKAIALGRVRYPATKETLLDEFGWRTFAFEPEKKVHLGLVIQKLPEQEYSSFEQIMRDASTLLGQ